MASWGYGIDYELSTSDVEDKHENEAGTPLPAADSTQPSTYDLYRLASLGSGVLRQREDIDSVGSPSLTQSPSQGRQQFVPIQLNLSQGSFTASVGGGVLSDDGGHSALTTTSLSAEAHLSPGSSEGFPGAASASPGKAVSSELPAGPPLQPPTPTFKSEAVHFTESASTMMPELLSETAHFPRPSPTTATPPSYEGMPPHLLHTGERPQRSAGTAIVPFPPAPSTLLDTSAVTTSTDGASPPTLAVGNDASRTLLPPPPPAPNKTAQLKMPSSPMRPLVKNVSVPPPPPIPTGRVHATPLEILAMADEQEQMQKDTTRAAHSPVEAPVLTAGEEVAPWTPPPLEVAGSKVDDTPRLPADVEATPSSPISGATASHSPVPPPATTTDAEPPRRSPSLSSSSSASRRRSASSHSGSRHSSHTSSPPSPPTPQAQSNSALPDRFFRGLSPLILQSNFHKTDIKSIACTASYTLVDEMAEYDVSLERLDVRKMRLLEPKETLCRAYEKLGRLRRQKHSRRSDGPQQTRKRIAPVTTEDFCAPLLRYDRLLYAVCFCLWESLLPYNDLVDALMARFFADITNPSEVITQVPASVLFRWLNDYGIDVLVMSHDRQSASSFCTRRACLPRNGLSDPSPLASARDGDALSGLAACANPMAAPPRDSLSPADARAGSPPPPPLPRHTSDRRVLVALEFDQRGNLWGPLTLSRSIRETALARRGQRKAVAQERAREERAAARRAERARRVERVKTKQLAWQKMVDDLQRASAPTALSDSRDPSLKTKRHKKGHRAKTHKRTDDVEEDEMFLAARAGPQMPMNAEDAHAPLFVATSDSAHPDPAAVVKVPAPFADMVYPNVNPTDFGVGPVLAKAASAWLPRTRLRLVLGVLLGLLSVVISIAAVAYTSVHLETCVYDTATGTCVTDAASSTCAALLLANMDSSFLARRALFGFPIGMGNCLVVCAACAFSGLIACVLVAFFSTRAVAVKSLFPRFAYVVYVVHVMLCAIVCAFAAYSLSQIVRGARVVECGWLPQSRQPVCAAHYAQCSGWHYRTDWPAVSQRRVALGLVACLVGLAALHFFSAALLLPMPSTSTQAQLTRAVPDTSCFQASAFTPDGVLPPAEARIRDQIEPHLARALQNRLVDAEQLVTNTITVAEMMRENREQSIRMTELAKTRRYGAARPDPTAQPATTAAATPTRRIGYVALRDPAQRHSHQSPESLLEEVPMSALLSSRIRTVQASMHSRLGPGRLPAAGPTTPPVTAPRPTADEKTALTRTNSNSGSHSGSDHGQDKQHDAGEDSSLFSQDDADTVCRTRGSSSLRARRATPPTTTTTASVTAAATTCELSRQTSVAIVIHEDASGSIATSLPSEPQGSPSSEPPQPSILATTSTAVHSSFGSPTTVTSVGRSAFGGAPATDRRVDHHVRTMKDNINQILRRLERDAEQEEVVSVVKK